LDWWDDLQDAAAYLREQTKDQPRVRIGAFGQDADHVFSLLPIYTGLPVYTGVSVPAHTYRFYFAGERDMGTVRALGIKYALVRDDWDRGKSGLTLRETFGSIKVFEVKDPALDRVTPVGDCAVQMLSDSNQGLQAEISQAQGPCRIRIHRSDYPNWRAFFDGVELSIERIPAHRGSQYAAFMSVMAPGNGTLRVAWHATSGDRAGAWIALMAWLVMLALIVFAVRPTDWERLIARLSPTAEGRPRIVRAIWGAVACVLICVLVLCFLRARETRYTFDRHIAEAERTVEIDNERVDCRASAAGGWVCGPSWDVVRAGLFSFVYDNRYCIFAHPSAKGSKHILFKDVPLEGRLSGFYGLLDSSRGGSTVHMDVKAGDAPAVRFSTRDAGRAIGFEVPTTPGTADVEITVQSKNPNWRHLCFNMQVLRDGDDG
jgi:hypothetical protein